MGKQINYWMEFENFRNTRYYFHLAEAGDIKTHMVNGKETLDPYLKANGNALIHAAYSFIVNEPTGVCGNRSKKEIRRARIYCITGYYDEDGKWIPPLFCFFIQASKCIFMPAAIAKKVYLFLLWMPMACRW